MSLRDEEINFIKFIKNYYSQTISLIDVGANLGLYSELFNKDVKTKKTYLFEPLRSCFNKIPKKENYVLHNICIGASKGEVIFHEALGKETHSSVVNREWLYKKPEYSINKKVVPINKLDNLFKEKIEVLKIDVEGYELEVLKGAANLLRDNKIDFIQFEYGGAFEDNFIKLNDVITFLAKYKYSVYEIKDGKFSKIENYIDDYKWINFYAIRDQLTMDTSSKILI